jgi:uncharacterized membrane protein
MLTTRLQAALGNPGQLYNIGNAIILIGGVSGALAAAIGDGNSLNLAFQRIVAHLWGSPSALALTMATLVFFAAGAAYSAAWKVKGPRPNPRLNKRGDLLSGVGALVLGVGLIMLGNAVMAIFAGLLHAFGKFGSAYGAGKYIRIGNNLTPLDDLCKDLVLVSRLPALLAALSGLVQTLTEAADLGVILLSSSVVVSTIYWALADILLLRRDGALMVGIRRALRLGGFSAAE